MANKYENAVQELMANCRVTPAGQTQEECCQAKGITECPTQTNSPPSWEEHGEILALGGLALLGAMALGVVAVSIQAAWAKKTWRLRIPSMRLSKFKQGYLAAVAIWAFLVCSYVALFKPYGRYSLRDEHVFSIVLWVLLPSIAALIIYLWLKHFTKLFNK